MFSQRKPMVKGCIELYKIKCVEIVCSDVPIPCNYKYPFQVSFSTNRNKNKMRLNVIYSKHNV